jgi:3-(3-hydroxy-phenyl)propionate hydroxylase
MNLGWKLARVVAGAPADLLDTYNAERHPVVARVLGYTMALTALQRGDDRTGALTEVLRDVLGLEAARDRLAGLVSGLDIRYELGGGHPLVGRRMPDLDLLASGRPVRVYELLHRARPVVISFGAPGSIDARATGIECLDAMYDRDWELPAIGRVEPPPAVLVRPDGYVGWAGEGGAEGLEAALTGCGLANAASSRGSR